MRNHIASTVGVGNTEKSRRKHLKFLYTKDKFMTDCFIGVFIFLETVFQKIDDGISFLNNNNVIPVIKVGKSFVSFKKTKYHIVTGGINGVAKHYQEYTNLGYKSANWRCVLKINFEISSSSAIRDFANVLAQCASICQQNGLITIVELELFWDGVHDKVQAQEPRGNLHIAVYKALSYHHDYLERKLLKPNLATTGESFYKKYAPEDVANDTVTALQRKVPPTISGVFLTGGQSEKETAVNLNVINKFYNEKSLALSLNHGFNLHTSVSERVEEISLEEIVFSSVFVDRPYWRPDYAPGITCLLEEIPLFFKRAQQFIKDPANNELLKEFIPTHQAMYITECNRGERTGTQTFEDTEIALNSKPEICKMRIYTKTRNLSNAIKYAFGESFYVETLSHQFNPDLAKKLNKLVGEGLFANAGSYRNLDAKPSGEDFYYLSPHQIEESINWLFAEVKEELDNKSWFERAGMFFAKFLSIHPFSNGNGRTARILLSALLTKYAIVPVCLFSPVEEENSNEVYLHCVREAQRYDNYSLLYSLIIENTHRSLHTFLYAFDITENYDLDSLLLY